MTNAIELAEYSGIKLIQSCLFNESMHRRLLDHLFDNDIFTIDFINSLENHVEEVTSLGVYEKEQIDGLFSIISFIRDNAMYSTEEEKKHYFQIYNKMIISLNRYQEKNSKNFYIREAVKRFQINPKILSKPKNYEIYKELVKESIGRDYTVLDYSVEFESEESFEKVIDYFALDVFYFACLNAMFIEYPELLNSITLRKRVKKVIELNNSKKSEIKTKPLFEKKHILRLNHLYAKEFNEA